jgi:hypothetical protein
VAYFPFSASSAMIVDLMYSAILYMVIMWVDYGVRNYPYTIETLSSMSVMTIWRLMGHVVIGLRVSGSPDMRHIMCRNACHVPSALLQ